MLNAAVGHYRPNEVVAKFSRLEWYTFGSSVY